MKEKKKEDKEVMEYFDLEKEASPRIPDDIVGVNELFQEVMLMHVRGLKKDCSFK